MRYSYATVGLPGLTPHQAIEELRMAGYHGVEWKVGNAHTTLSGTAEAFIADNRCTVPISRDAAAEIGERTRAAGLAVVGLCPYLEIGDVESLRVLIGMAVAAGAPQIRLQAARPARNPASYRELFAHTVNYLRTAEHMAREVGVRIVLETHQDTIAPSASLAYRLVCNFDPAIVGVIYDVGNLVFEGYENHGIALEMLGPYLHHVHLKNVAALRTVEDGEAPRWRYMWSALDDGLVDVAGVLTHLQSVGYRGWISVEDFSTQRDSLATLRHNAQILKAMPEAAWLSRTPASSP